MTCSNPALDPIYIGDDYSFTMTFTDVAGVAINLTGYTIVVTMKSKKSDVTPLWTSSITSHTDAVNGETTITIDAIDSAAFVAGNYVIGAYWVDTNNKLKTILDTTIRVLEPVVIAEVPN